MFRVAILQDSVTASGSSPNVDTANVASNAEKIWDSNSASRPILVACLFRVFEPSTGQQADKLLSSSAADG
jgi:hypothetical protein